jgi:hypothetical protein
LVAVAAAEAEAETEAATAVRMAVLIQKENGQHRKQRTLKRRKHQGKPNKSKGMGVDPHFQTRIGRPGSWL